MGDDDFSQPGRINSRMYKFVMNALQELYNHIRVGGNQDCPHLRTLSYQVELYAIDYKDVYRGYTEDIKDIEDVYGKNKYLSTVEHIKRMQIYMNVLHDIGTFRLHARYPYPEENPPDEYDFNVFNYDIKEVDSDLPIVQKLKAFYYDELVKEYEDKPDKLRRDEAERRAKRSYLFINKYKEYEKNGFKKEDIVKIFGIDKQQQRIMNHWIDEFLPYGISTSIFAKAGMGKSNTSSFICQMVLVMKPDWDIITDLPIIFSPLMDPSSEYEEIRIDRFHFVTNMYDLLMETSKIGLNNRIPSILLDEFDSALVSEQMRAKGGMNLRHYVFLERHWDTRGPLFVFHTRKDIPVVMREAIISHDVYMVTRYYNYLSRSKPKRVVSNPNSWNYKRFGGERYLPIPLTTLPYHSFGTSPFTVMDVDMQWLNVHVTGTKREALKQIQELLPQRGWDKEYQKERKKEEERRQKELQDEERRKRMEERRKQDQDKRMGRGKPT